MKLSLHHIYLSALSISLIGCTSMPSQPTTLAPANLQAPAEQSFAFELAAKGVQIYTCKANSKDASQYEWAFVAPEAELFRGTQMENIGLHGAGPFWSMNDGGRIVGEVVAKSDSPNKQAIPWLLLKVKMNSGLGEFAQVKSIQRVATAEGKAPTSGCDAMNLGKEVRIPYTATYNFFR
ncbi:MAG: DUF3455 domain-containing protein [Burkholderiaceae bacterium]|nr:MAG: DUF3455 domain-containing protein [Burkholderiaceae bacterium]